MTKKELNKITLTTCPIRNTVELVGGKWTFSIIYILLKEGTKRFGELEKSIQGINTRMLVKELKMLEANKIINRKVYAAVPPKVEYSLTEKGIALEPVLKEIRAWGVAHIV